jgi:KDO2-lipid IV(A) lauroyltransferase
VPADAAPGGWPADARAAAIKMESDRNFPAPKRKNVVCPRFSGPPLRWFAGDAVQRQEAWRYWGRDTAKGILNLGIHHLLRVLPTDVCSDCGAVMGSWSGRHRYPAQNRRARTAWSRLRPEAADPATVEAAMERLWRNVGRTMAEFSVLDRLWQEGRVTVTGAEHVAAVRSAGQPLLVVCMHLGNWETIGVALVGLGYRGASFYQPPRNRFEHRIAVRIRHRFAGSDSLVLTSQSGLREIYRVLAQADFMMMFVDESIDGRVHGPLFGRPLEARGNLARVVRIARRSGAALVPAFAERLDGARFRVNFLPPLDLVREGNREEGARENMRRVDAAITPIVRERLDQWYMLLDFRFDR